MTNAKNHIGRLKQARNFAQSKATTDYLLVHKDGTSPTVGELDFRKTVQQELTEIVVKSLTEIIDDLRDGSRALKQLDVVNTVSEESLIQYAHSSNLPNSALINTLTSNSSYSKTKYDPDNTPDFQLIKATDGNKTLMGVQNHQSLKTYSSNQKGLSIIYRNQVYEKFSEDLFIIPESVNAIYFDGYVYIDTPKSFEKMFEMRNEYEKHASNVITELKKAGIEFSNGKIPNEWLTGDIRILRKMYAVHENQVASHATPDNIKDLIDKYNVGVNYTKKNGKIKLDIDNYTDIWKLLKVLNADYAEAEIIPNAKLEIDAKRII